MNKRSLIVISDIHIGAGPLDDCDGELQSCLVRFLEQLCSRETPVELVINGDFLDFAQAAPWKGRELESESPLGIPLCFTEEQSRTKLESIVTEHIAVFKVLGELLRCIPENKLVILPGNHDADFFWPKVRDLFTEKVCGQSIQAREGLHFHLEQTYGPVDVPGVWIEHGNQHDPINSFYVDEYDSISGANTGKQLYWSRGRPPIFVDRNGFQRLYECTGTRFLIKFLNQLDADYPFVDNVKPFSKFLTTFGVSALASGYGPIKASLAVFGMVRYLLKTVVTNTGDLLGINSEQSGQVASIVAQLLAGLSSSEKKAFVERLRERGFKVDRPIDMYFDNAGLTDQLLTYLSENLDLVADLPQPIDSYLSASGDEGYLSLAKGFNIDETRELMNAADKVTANNKTDVAIMGHTHEPVNDRLKTRYFNTGSWTRYYDFKEKKLEHWSILRNDSYKLFPFQLNFVEITPGRERPAQMVTFLEKRV